MKSDEKKKNKKKHENKEKNNNRSEIMKIRGCLSCEKLCEFKSKEKNMKIRKKIISGVK